jgi:hypothetical protein
MTQEVMRIRLKSLSDLQRQQARIYRECRSGLLDTSTMTALSQVLKRLHDQMVSVKELDISEELLALETQLAELESRR